MPNKLLTLILLLALLISACQEAPSLTELPTLPTETQTQSPVPTQLPTETIKPFPTITENPTSTATLEATHVSTNSPVENPPLASSVEIQAEDGTLLAGTFYSPDSNSSPAPGVILLHMLWGERSSWEDFAIQLIEAGYAVLTIDFRGHGETGGKVDWEKAVQDVGQIWEYLREHDEVDNDRLGLVGASIGANVALAAAGLEPEVKTVVLLSPGRDYAGVKTYDPMIDYGERPVLIAASEEDTYAAESGLWLKDLAAGETKLIMYPGSGHGTIMLDREPDLPNIIIAWLGEHLQ